MQAPAPRPRRPSAVPGPARRPGPKASPPAPRPLPLTGHLLIGGLLAGGIALLVILAVQLDHHPPRPAETPAPAPVQHAAVRAPEKSETPPTHDEPLETDLLSMVHNPPSSSEEKEDLARLIGDGLAEAPEIDGVLPAALPPPELPRLPSPDLPPEAKKPPWAIVPPAPEPAPEVKVPVVPPRPAEPPKPAAGDAALLARLEATEDDLRKQLSEVPEVRLISDLDLQGLRVTKVVEEAGVKTTFLKGGHLPSSPLLEKRFREAGLAAGLPLQFGPRSRLDPDAALVVQTLSKDLRKMGFVSLPPPPPPRKGAPAPAPAPEVPMDSPEEKIKAFKQWCDLNQVEKYRGALATLLQMLQVEDVPTRLLLVKELAKVKNANTTVVLAGRALMDLSPEVRKAAVEALKKRPAEQYVPVLVKGLRYPWAPVADHAALALKELDAKSTIPLLVKLLDQPSPHLPFADKESGQFKVREMVRLNHMRNCFLCHPPSAAPDDGLVRGAVPTPGQAVGSYQGRSNHFVRADTTFLRQDFSVVLVVVKDPPWPNEQRFDFVTRLRPAKPEELREIGRVPKPGGLGEIAKLPMKPGDPGEIARTPMNLNYPQRESVLFTLRGLTGKDAGDSSERWRELLSIPAAAPSPGESPPDKTTPAPAPDKTTGPAKENVRLP